MIAFRPGFFAAGFALLAGCAIPPRAQHPDLSAAAPLAGVPTSAEAAWPDATWWHRYHDEQLNDLEARALQNAPTLAVARTRFDLAAHNVDVARADGGASVNGSAQLQRERLSENGLIPSKFLGFNWYGQGDLGASFNYDFDFWGAHGAAISAAVDRTRAAAAERDAAASMLTAAVAEAYFGWQADQARLDVARFLADNAEKGRRIAAARVRQDIDSPDNLQQADILVAATHEQVVGLEGSVAIRHAALAALIDVAPEQLGALKIVPLPAAGSGLPANAGLDLIARRPDVAASRWRVEAALKDTDVARAAFYPDISLSALAGLSSIDLGKMLSPGSAVFAAGPALHLPIFEGGRLRARFGVSQAALAAAVADYRNAVNDAARDVSVQALTLRQALDRAHAQSAQLDSAEKLFDTARSRMDRGLIDARPVIVAGANLATLKDTQIQLHSTALSAEIALTRALGGGYSADSTSSKSTSGVSSP
ncbi:MAG TPA: efflux transporter outer membrane subunit [Rudaea sp.]|nr:efflux transporter outer membrane subunit [Rudaea sp.]